jgi:hypothetical protein
VHRNGRFQSVLLLGAILSLMTVLCGSAVANGSVVSVRVSADRPTYQGACPVRVTVTGIVVTNAPVDKLAVEFRHASGYRSPMQVRTSRTDTTFTFQEVLVRGVTSAPWDESIQLVVITPALVSSQAIRVQGTCTGTGVAQGPRRAAVVVTAVGFRVVHHTTEGVIDLTGAGDEVTINSWDGEYITGVTVAPPSPVRSTLPYGDTNFHYGPPFALQHGARVRAGNLSTTGGLRDGDTIPQGGQYPPPPAGITGIADRLLPMRLWSGFIQDGSRANVVVIVPTIWEEDDSTLNLGPIYGRMIREKLRLGASGFLQTLLSPRTALAGIEDWGLRESISAGAPQVTRPIGMAWDGPHAYGQAEQAVSRFNPWVLRLTLASVLPAASATDRSGSGRPGDIDLRYTDEAEWAGDYMLTVNIRVDSIESTR